MVREYDPDYDPTLPPLPDYAEEEAADARYQREQARIAWAEAEWERQLAEEAAAAAQEAQAVAAQEAAAASEQAGVPAAQEAPAPVPGEAFVVALDHDEDDDPAVIYPALPLTLTVQVPPPTKQRRRKHPLKRPVPSIKDVAPWHPVARPKTGGHLAAIYEAMTMTTHPLEVVAAGINALVELRYELQSEAPVGGLNHLPSQLLLQPLWSHPALSEEIAGIETVLAREIRAMVQTLEVVPFVQRGPFRAALEQVREELLRGQQGRLEEIIERLRERVRQRGAVRRIARVIKQVAWEVMMTLGTDRQAVPA